MGKYLIVQVPCFNEEKTLPQVLQDIIDVRNQGIDGIDRFEIQIIDDGSVDRTVEIAKEFKVENIIKLEHNSGLGVAFKTGLENCLRLNADILVNTDGDNQYPAKYIPELIRPILEGKSNIVIGNRQTAKIKHFSPIKKMLQALGSKVVRLLTKSKVQDTVSGFRAYSRGSLIEINLTSDFSYVLDSIVQAETKRIKISEVLIDTNAPTRKSRLFSNIFQHIRKSLSNLLTVFLIYHSNKIFLPISLLTFFIALVIGIRYLIFRYILNFAVDNIQSLILSAILFSLSANSFILYLLSILINKNRKLLEDILIILKKKLLNDK